MTALMTWNEFRSRPIWPHRRRFDAPTIVDIDTFLMRVVVGAPDECWPWAAGYHSDGYGVAFDGRTRKTGAAHRLAWSILRGPIPAGMHILHRCDNRRCVNPDHLYLGTPKANGRDRKARIDAAKAAGKWSRSVRVDPWEAVA